MKHLITILLLTILAIPASGQGQGREHDRRKAEFEEFKQKRVEYISKAMKLSESEATAFWPVCFELWEKKFEADRQFRRRIREFMKDEREGKEHTESDYRQIIEIFADKRLREAELDKEYMQKFLKILPAEKVFLFQGAEQDFVREMLNEKRKK